jgi:hypothetical protein
MSDCAASKIHAPLPEAEPPPTDVGDELADRTLNRRQTSPFFCQGSISAHLKPGSAKNKIEVYTHNEYAEK